MDGAESARNARLRASLGLPQSIDIVGSATVCPPENYAISLMFQGGRTATEPRTREFVSFEAAPWVGSVARILDFGRGDIIFYMGER
jgi:hypothetical protein